jgi:hypothetical protein
MSREIGCSCISIKLQKQIEQLNKLAADARHEFVEVADKIAKSGLPFEETLGELRNKIYTAADLSSKMDYDSSKQFPQRENALIKICKGYGVGTIGQCDILEEHGDGDLTVQTEDNVFVITTDGRIFKEVKQEPIK